MFRKALALGTATVVAATASVLLFGFQANARDVRFSAKLRDPQGEVVGTVKFRVTHHAMYVVARLKPNDNVTANQFHGFHIHANNVPGNGKGCLADPAEARGHLVRIRGWASIRGRTGTRRTQWRPAESAGDG